MKHLKPNLYNKPDAAQDSFPVAVILSQFNYEITQKLLQGTLQRLIELGMDSADIMIVEVPGAIEIPLIALQLAKKKLYGAMIALGAVIRGETSHYDYVCEQVSQGLQRISLDFAIPIIFGILTTDDEAQAWERCGGNHGHKGIDAADSALAMHAILQELSSI